MAAANFSREVLENFYELIRNEENRMPEFEIVRTNFNIWLRVWKMWVLGGGNQDILKFFQNKEKQIYRSLQK